MVSKQACSMVLCSNRLSLPPPVIAALIKAAMLDWLARRRCEIISNRERAFHFTVWCVADGIVGDIIPDALEGNSGSICSLDASEIRDAVADGGAVALSATNPVSNPVRCSLLTGFAACAAPDHLRMKNATTQTAGSEGLRE